VIPETQDIADAKYCRRKVLQTQSIADAKYCVSTNSIDEVPFCGAFLFKDQSIQIPIVQV